MGPEHRVQHCPIKIFRNVQLVRPSVRQPVGQSHFFRRSTFFRLFLICITEATLKDCNCTTNAITPHNCNLHHDCNYNTIASSLMCNDVQSQRLPTSHNLQTQSHESPCFYCLQHEVLRFRENIVFKSITFLRSPVIEVRVQP